MTTPDRYESLLLAFPVRLRRRHGAELIATMFEMAGPDEPPARADRWRLVLDGLRERFRLPPRRPLAVVAAVLALLIGGALGAAAGSWAGMWTFAKMPAPGPLAERVLGADSVPDSLGQSRFWLTADRVLKPGVDATAAANSARARLVADGWTATSVVVAGGGADGSFRRAGFQADRGGVRITMRSYYSDDHQIDIGGWPLRPPTYLPLVFAGLLLGLLGGWLAAAALAYRIAGSFRRRASAGTAAAGLLLLTLPTASVYVFLAHGLPNRPELDAVEFVHRALATSPVFPLNWYETLGPSWLTSPYLNKELLVAGLAAVVCAAIIGRPGRIAREPTDPQAA
jgi:hypothetical protein